MTGVVPLRETAAPVNQSALDLALEVVERIRSGETIAAAFVEVQRGNNVVTSVCKSSSYHHLNSGAARLAAQLATTQDGD